MEKIILKEYDADRENLFTQPKIAPIKCVTNIDNTILYQNLILGRINLDNIKYKPKPNRGFNKYLNNKFLYINKRGSL